MEIIRNNKHVYIRNCVRAWKLLTKKKIYLKSILYIHICIVLFNVEECYFKEDLLKKKNIIHYLKKTCSR